MAVRRVQPGGAGVRDRLVVAALVQFGVAEQHVDRRPGAALGAQAERGAHGEPEPWPSEPVPISTPGHQQPVRVVAERAVRPGQVVQPLVGDEALGGQHRVVGGRAVPLGEQEPVPVRVVDARRATRRAPGRRAPTARPVWRRRSARASRRRSAGGAAAQRRQIGSCGLGCKLKSLQLKGRRDVDLLTIGGAGRPQRRGAVGAALLRADRADPASRTGGNQRRYERASCAGWRSSGSPSRSASPWTRSGRRWPSCPSRPYADARPTGPGCRRAGAADLDERIGLLERLRDELTGCIGCGCLSLRVPALQPGRPLARRGPGPRLLVEG